MKTSDSLSHTQALLIIDMQNDGIVMVPPARSAIPCISHVANFYRDKNFPVLYKTRIHRANGVDVEKFRIELFNDTPFLVKGTYGAEIVEELKPLDGEIVVEGTRFSGFFQTDLHIVLTRLGVKTLVICGGQTPNCIRATVTDALAYDYNVILLSDATVAQTTEIHLANLLDMKNMGVEIMTSDELLHSITCRQANRDA